MYRILVKHAQFMEHADKFAIFSNHEGLRLTSQSG